MDEEKIVDDLNTIKNMDVRLHSIEKFQRQ